jgi:hypothetical protein
MQAGCPRGPNFVVSAPAGAYPSEPSAASDGLGDFVVVWVDQYAGIFDAGILGRRYAADGTELGTPFLVDSYTTALQRNPWVSAASDGRFVAVWTRPVSGTTFPHIYGQRMSAAGTPLGSAFRVSNDTANAYPSSVASDPEGDFIVEWWEFIDGIRGERYGDDGASLGAAYRVSSSTAVENQSGVFANGRLITVWQRTDATGGITARIDAGVFTRGNANGDHAVDVADVFYLINSLFAGGPPPVQPMDLNLDGRIDVGDVFYLIDYLFAGGPAPL